MMKRVIVSAPGKIHLMGEHAVVYGKPALIAAINKRLYAQVTENTGGVVITTTEEKRLVQKAIEIVCSRFSIDSPSVAISLSSSIPSGRHAGSSAAVSVAVVGALLYFLKKIWNPTLINELAYEVEKYQHGNPSGGDNSAATYGGFIWFRKEMEFLKTIWQLPMSSSSLLQSFSLVDTGKPSENTGDMVSLVRNYMDECADAGRLLLDQNEQATKDVAVALKSNNEELLIDALRRGEKTLEGLGVVSDSVVPFIQSVENSGGAVKILGGGGKKGAVGLLLVYFPDTVQLKKISQRHSYVWSSVILGEEGVRLETGKEKQL